MSRLFFVLGLGVTAALAGASTARAEYRACNETSHILEVAVGTVSQAAVISRGWFDVAPGACRTILRAPLDEDLSLFAYARSSALYGMDALTFSGTTPFCMEEGEFLIEGSGMCRRRGFGHARFASVDFDAAEWTTWFSEEAAYGFRDSAVVAGQQRLLALLGYAVGAIDGIHGARTRLALEAFRAEYGVAADAEAEELFAALAAALEARREEEGLALCNRSEYEVFAAVGVGSPAEEGEESEVETRGWWAIASGECASLVAEPLDGGGAYYLFAETGDAAHVWGGEHMLCVNAIRFVIARQGGEQGDCAARHYEARGFWRVAVGSQARFVEVLE